MPKRSVEFFIIDMLLSVDRIKRFAKNIICVDAFIRNETAVGVILRDFSIIGEAMNHVLHTKKLHYLTKPEWRNIVDFRNIVIHDYFGLSYEEVFEIIKKEIPILEKELITLLLKVDATVKIELAIKDIKDELETMQRTHSLKYISKLEKILKVK